MPTTKKAMYVRAVKRLKPMISTIDRFGETLNNRDFLKALRGSNTRGNVEKSVHDLWNATERLGDVVEALKKAAQNQKE
jgi:hypothetical protein